MIAGKRGWLYESILTRVRELNLETRVKFLDYAPIRDLPPLYAGAQCAAWRSDAIVNAFAFCEPARPAACGSCGNGVVELPEACDDGNSDSGDSCSSSCDVEAGFRCGGALPASAHRRRLSRERCGPCRMDNGRFAPARY